jgi:WD40 repeat protein
MEINSSNTTATPLYPMDASLEPTFKGHQSYVNTVCFSPRLKQLASGSGEHLPTLRTSIGNAIIYIDHIHYIH